MQEYIITVGNVKGKLVFGVGNGTKWGRKRGNTEAIEFSVEIDYNNEIIQREERETAERDKEGVQMQENDELQIQLRKNQDTLKIVGLGVMAFGAWSVVKTILSTTLQWSTIIGEMNVPGVDRRIQGIAFIIMSAVILAVEIAIRLYIGRAAIAEGKGEKRGPGYIAVTFVITVLGLAMTIASIVVPGLRTELSLDVLVSLFVELTSTIVALEMCWSAIQVRKLRRQLAERG